MHMKLFYLLLYFISFPKKDWRKLKINDTDTWKSELKDNSHIIRETVVEQLYQKPKAKESNSNWIQNRWEQNKNNPEQTKLNSKLYGISYRSSRWSAVMISFKAAAEIMGRMPTAFFSQKQGGCFSWQDIDY